MNPPWWGLRGRKCLILITLDRWKRYFREKNYIENYFYLLKSTKSTKTTSQKCWRNIWADFFGRPYRSNGIKARLGSLLSGYRHMKLRNESNHFLKFSGYRHIKLRNESYQPLALPTLFVDIVTKDFVPKSFSGKV